MILQRDSTVFCDYLVSDSSNVLLVCNTSSSSTLYWIINNIDYFRTELGDNYDYHPLNKTLIVSVDSTLNNTVYQCPISIDQDSSKARFILKGK